MKYTVYEFIDVYGNMPFKKWREKLDKPNLAALTVKINAVRTWDVGTEFPTNMISGTSIGGILKLRVYRSVQMRPRLCRGPINYGQEISFLCGAIEVNMETQPLDADERADKNRAEIVSHPNLRRCIYVAAKPK